MWERIKEVYAGAFLIFTTAWLLLHLILIELYGIVRIAEANQWTLWTEIGIATLILALAIERFVRDIKR